MTDAEGNRELTEQERKERIEYHLAELKKLRATPRSGANRPVDDCSARTVTE